MLASSSMFRFEGCHGDINNENLPNLCLSTGWQHCSQYKYVRSNLLLGSTSQNNTDNSTLPVLTCYGVASRVLNAFFPRDFEVCMYIFLNYNFSLFLFRTTDFWQFNQITVSINLLNIIHGFFIKIKIYIILMKVTGGIFPPSKCKII